MNDVDNGRGYACVMDKGYVENLYTFLFYIAMILKLLQKKKKLAFKEGQSLSGCRTLIISKWTESQKHFGRAQAYLT